MLTMADNGKSLTRRIAAIDIGTNTAKILVADVALQGNLQILADEERRIRFGKGVDATGTVPASALARLRRTLLDYRELADRLGAELTVVAGTSASRDVRRSVHLPTWVKAETGLDFDVLTGKQEAVWSFRGALTGLPELTGSCITLDIGGGSTEVVAGRADGTVEAWQSMNVGSTRLTERFLILQPPRPAELRRAEEFIRDMLRRCEVKSGEGPLICASESPRILSSLLHDGDAGRHGGLAILEAADVIRSSGRFLGMSRQEVLALDPPRMQGREDVFPSAVLILAAALRHYRLSRCLISPHSLRHGLVLRAAGHFSSTV